MEPVAPPAPTAAEAARYAVLRRLGPALRHDLVVNLQAVAMMTEVLGARLDRSDEAPPAAAPVAPADLSQQLVRIHALVRSAVDDALRVATWLCPPGDDEGVPLSQGVDECLALVRSPFGFRGIVLHAQVDPAAIEVSRQPLRLLLLAALLHLADQDSAPCELRVHADVQGHEAALAIERLPAPDPLARGTPGADELGYRRLAPTDLQALAAEAGATGITLALQGRRVLLRLPRLVATTPLQIAPR